MLKIDPQSQTLVSLGERSLRPASLGERYRLRDLVTNSPEAFLSEANSELLPLATALPIADGAAHKLDLVAASADGRVYTGLIGEADRNADLIKALEDASITATWGWRGLLRRLDASRAAELERFLNGPLPLLNREQGVLLIAEKFDAETLKSAAWLRNRYRVDVVCLQTRMAVDSISGLEYVVCQDISTGEAADISWADLLEPTESQSKAAPQPPKLTAEGALEQWETELTHKTTARKAPARKAPVRKAPARTAPLRRASAAEALRQVPVSRPAQRPAQRPAPPAPKPEDEILETPFIPIDPQQEEFEAVAMANLSPEDDPLAPFLNPQVEPASVGQPDEDRRGAGRTEDVQARRLRLDYYGRLLGARLVDFSNKGLGVEALSPLPVGSEVGISGEFVGADGALEIEGRVRVTHCRSRDDGVCRIGFSLADATLKKIDSAEAFGRR